MPWSVLRKLGEQRIDLREDGPGTAVPAPISCATADRWRRAMSNSSR